MTSTITLSSLSKFPDLSVAVCAHDAGAANHIFSWLRPLRSKLRFCLGGPAISLYRRYYAEDYINHYSLEDCIGSAKVLISGTSWSSDIEDKARQIARNLSIPSVAVLDHWVNYHDRFLMSGSEVLPDVIWVSDIEAATLARRIFDDLPVFQLPNQWLEGIKDKVSMSLVPHIPTLPARRLLYLLEPNSFDWLRANIHSESRRSSPLLYFLRMLPKLIDGGWVAPVADIERITFRQHPSGSRSDIVEFLSNMNHLPVFCDNDLDLADSLAISDIVFGAETQALVAAMACGLTAFSTLSPGSASCRIPHSSLHHLNQLGSL